MQLLETSSPSTTPAFATLAVRGGPGPDPATGAILTPIHQTTTYVQDGVGLDRGHTYSRSSNPTVSALETALGQLEGTGPAACFATGMAATTALLTAVCSAGDRVVCSDVVYGGTVRLLRGVLSRFGVEAVLVDTSDLDALADALREETRLVFLESPANPTLKLTDLRAACGLARRAGALAAVDNTFLTPALQRPLELGADFALYSTTKYLEGHNATVGGAVLAASEERLAEVRAVRNTLGSIQSPFEAWLTLRGLKTLPLRMKQHCENALAVARWLSRHPAVARVTYPGLESFPQRDLARAQQAAAGGMLTFELEGGAAEARRVMASLELCSLAENLGAAETLVTHPASMTHGDMDPVERDALGIRDGLVRLSVGLEEAADIIQDLARAISKRQE